jgi:cation diffusion facilitator family transporter
MNNNFLKNKLSEKEKVILLSVLSNASLVVIKLIVGFLSGLVSIMAEALHSANDLIASFVAYIGVKKALSPPDKDHQYGHGKIEILTGAIENILILLIAVYIIYEGINKLIHKTSPEYIETGIAVMVFSGILNFILSNFLIKKGRELRSIGIEVDGEHLRADVITSLGVAFALIILKITNIWWIDPIAAILVGIWVFFIFIRLLKKLVEQTIDTGISEQDIAFIEKTLNDIKEIKFYHKIRTRQSGSTIFIDMHIKVDKKLSVEKSHNITKIIEEKLKEKFGDVNVLVHVEPSK